MARSVKSDSSSRWPRWRRVTSLPGSSVETTPRRRRAPRGAGDQLRDEILDAATDLLLETGHVKAVSIRSVAQRVGVTPPSIYLHFADKDALMDAVCARYFERLDAEMQRAAVGCTSTLELLRAQGLAYVRFGLQTPELYRIATMGEGRPGSDVDLTLTSSAFVHMRAGVQAMMEEGLYSDGDATQLALELWSAAHGVAALLIAKPYLPWGDVEVFTDRVLRAVCCGQMVSGIVGYDSGPQDTIELLTNLKKPRRDE
jgi:AcrR family transcriptional regulator